MGSATTGALAAARQALSRAGSAVGLKTAEELFAVGHVLGASAQLRALVSDPSTPSAAKSDVVRRVFGGTVSDQTLSLVDALVGERWSSQDDLLAGIEEIGVRAIASSAPAQLSLDSELFDVGKAVAAHPDLELALRSKLATPEAKATLVEKILSGTASEQTVALVRQVVMQPRGRSVREALRKTAAIVASQAGLSIATVTSARQLGDAQLKRLQAGLSRAYGRDLRFNQVVDPALIGGLRVQVGDDVIDSSVATRLASVRLQLAG
jgi:F-type H+-transporting ATPase subunit delta